LNVAEQQFESVVVRLGDRKRFAGGGTVRKYPAKAAKAVADRGIGACMRRNLGRCRSRLSPRRVGSRLGRRESALTARAETRVVKPGLLVRIHARVWTDAGCPIKLVNVGAVLIKLVAIDLAGAIRENQDIPRHRRPLL
jgi:hypothetical protein